MATNRFRRGQKWGSNTASRARLRPGPVEVEQERVGSLLLADGRGRSVTWVNLRLVREVQQPCEDARRELGVIASQVSSTYGAGKQGVAPDGEGRVVGRADEDDRAGAV